MQSDFSLMGASATKISQFQINMTKMYNAGSSTYEDVKVSDRGNFRELQVQQMDTVPNPCKQQEEANSTSSLSILEDDSEQPKQELYLASRDELSSYQEAEEFLIDPKHSKYQTLKENTPQM